MSRQLLDICGAIDCGDNLFFHGPGGTGKTYTIREIIKNRNPEHVQVLCPTGMAAVEIGLNAMTICKYFGIGAVDADKMDEVEKLRYLDAVIRKNRYKKCNLQLIIIDEISMVGALMLRAVDRILRRVYDNAPFGGIQVIVSGDFYQLPPVKDEWCFKTDVWKSLDLCKFTFDIGHRYTSPETFDMMLRIRTGELNDLDKEILSLRNIVPRVVPVMLLAKNRNVDAYNSQKLGRIDSVEYVFKSVDSITYHHTGLDMIQDHIDGFVNPEVTRKQRLFEKIHERDAQSALDDICPETVSLKIGAKVLVCRNYMPGVVNGSVGKVISVNTDSVTVDIKNRQYNIESREFAYENKFFKCVRKQFPFKLGWAISIHKSQGMTLDSAVVRIDDVWSPGQAYVAISRVVDINRLYIIGKMVFDRIYAHPEIDV